MVGCLLSEDLHEGARGPRVVGAVSRQPGEEMEVLAAGLRAIARSVGVRSAVDDADGLLEFLHVGDGSTGGDGHLGDPAVGLR